MSNQDDIIIDRVRFENILENTILGDCNAHILLSTLTAVCNYTTDLR